MRLSTILNEVEVERRDFLKSMAGTAMSGNSMLGLLSSAASSAAVKYAREIDAFRRSGLSYYQINAILFEVVKIGRAHV